MSKCVEWLIIGGGIHGVHIAASLIGKASIAPTDLRLIDPNDHLLHTWHERTKVTGMSYMRSPAVHHLGLSPWELMNFAGKKKKKRNKNLFAPPYDRPSLELFNRHARDLIQRFSLSDLHIKSWVLECIPLSDGVCVKLKSGHQIIAQNVVIAIGQTDQALWPEWAPKNHPLIHHIFDHEFNGWPSSAPEAIAVVGGGISACQIALRLEKEGHHVHLISRHPLREHQFDSDPGWLGPRFMTAFQREGDIKKRRQLINEARHRGSIPPDINRSIKRAIQNQKMDWHLDQPTALATEDEICTMVLESGAILQVSRVLLATGFTSARPGGRMVDSLVEAASLKCADCGYPIVDSALRWHKDIFVSGPLAELEIGPASRNIAGAMRASDRIVKAAQSMEQRLKKTS